MDKRILILSAAAGILLIILLCLFAANKSVFLKGTAETKNEPAVNKPLDNNLSEEERAEMEQKFQPRKGAEMRTGTTTGSLKE